MSGFPGHFILETEDLVKMDCLTSDQQNKINCLQLHESHVIVVNFFFIGHIRKSFFSLSTLSVTLNLTS